MGHDESKPHSESFDSSERLLEDDDVPLRSRKEVHWFQKSWRLILASACALYIVVTAPIIIMMMKNRIPQPYSPVNNLLSYERVPLYFAEDLKYAGNPEVVDAAWDHLLEPINIRTTKEELQQAHAPISEDIVRVADGDYVSVLSVYHELHCLNTLRRNLFRDYYAVNSTAREDDYNIVHMTHCIDTIRRSLMCKADVALYTAYWIGDQNALPSKELRSESDTVCVNWDAIEEWSRARLLPRDKYKVKPGPFENLSGHT